MITNNDSDPIQPGSEHPQVPPNEPVQQIDPADAERFSDLQQRDQKNKEMLASSDESAISPEELQTQIQKNLFKQGFDKAIEKAREIAKELKEG
ncbi:hypothetical protein EOPP23_04100 [Endozoicomonas sp. OPT23]|uniref:hypothetical protein n=1 Tax=Endozoicomonas sp. OPT23 TaxID=2072845 RepID=UPI00129BDE62|nr:hypothetical protein [Endozoicomonas sp. OPT23]MRI32178.1 hypothetical protein [Endozoicomonas sp. OPT23]